jgi:hypothetical protein
MSIVDLINHVGMDNVRVQPLTQGLTGATYRKKLKATEVKFLTNEMSCGDLLGGDDPKRKIGLILWIEQGRLPKQ